MRWSTYTRGRKRILPSSLPSADCSSSPHAQISLLFSSTGSPLPQALLLLAQAGTQPLPLSAASCQQITGDLRVGGCRAWSAQWRTARHCGEFSTSPLSFSFLHQSPLHYNVRIAHSTESQRKSPQEGNKHKSKYDCLKNIVTLTSNQLQYNKNDMGINFPKLTQTKSWKI